MVDLWEGVPYTYTHTYIYLFIYLFFFIYLFIYTLYNSWKVFWTNLQLGTPDCSRFSGV